MAVSARRSSGPVLPSIGPVLASGRSMSGGNGGASIYSAFASYSSSFNARSPASFFTDHQQHQHSRSASPTRVNLVGSGAFPAATAVRFSVARPTSPGRSLAAADNRSSPARRTCLCSPTNHPGSFRCSVHKGLNLRHNGSPPTAAASSPSNRLNALRSAMANSLVRIGAVEGEWLKRALAALIRPSSHQQRRRSAFQPQPSRLSRVSKADAA